MLFTHNPQSYRKGGVFAVFIFLLLGVFLLPAFGAENVRPSPLSGEIVESTEFRLVSVEKNPSTKNLSLYYVKNQNSGNDYSLYFTLSGSFTSATFNLGGAERNNAVATYYYMNGDYDTTFEIYGDSVSIMMLSHNTTLTFVMTAASGKDYSFTVRCEKCTFMNISAGIGGGVSFETFRSVTLGGGEVMGTVPAGESASFELATAATYVTPSGNVVSKGDEISLKINPDPGYKLKTVSYTVDGEALPVPQSVFETGEMTVKCGKASNYAVSAEFIRLVRLVDVKSEFLNGEGINRLTLTFDTEIKGLSTECLSVLTASNDVLRINGFTQTDCGVYTLDVAGAAGDGEALLAITLPEGYEFSDGKIIEAIVILYCSPDFVPVTGIELVSGTVFPVGGSLFLEGYVNPPNAAKKAIVYTVADAYGDETAYIDGNRVYAGKPGELLIMAVVKEGAAEGGDFTCYFTVTVTERVLISVNASSQPLVFAGGAVLLTFEREIASLDDEGVCVCINGVPLEREHFRVQANNRSSVLLLIERSSGVTFADVISVTIAAEGYVVNGGRPVIIENNIPSGFAISFGDAGQGGAERSGGVGFCRDVKITVDEECGKDLTGMYVLVQLTEGSGAEAKRSFIIFEATSCEFTISYARPGTKIDVFLTDGFPDFISDSGYGALQYAHAKTY